MNKVKSMFKDIILEYYSFIGIDIDNCDDYSVVLTTIYDDVEGYLISKARFGNKLREEILKKSLELDKKICIEELETAFRNDLFRYKIGFIDPKDETTSKEMKTIVVTLKKEEIYKIV